MKKLTLIFIVCLIGFSSTVWAASFINGGFESGDTTGWTLGAGYRVNIYNNTFAPIMSPIEFLPGGSNYNATYLNHSAIVTPGIAPYTDSNLNRVYGGVGYSFRAEDLVNGGYASAITQRVNSYSDSKIFFAWAAVLEGSHSNYDAATFKLVLRDETAAADLITREYNAAAGGGGVDQLFTLSSAGYYYTAWQTEELTLAAGDLGHDFSLTLLAADCEQTGHTGMVYLDGFGATAPPPGPGGAVPEPATMLLLGSGLVGLAGYARRRFKK